MKKRLSISDVQSLLRQAAEKAGSQSAIAKQFGVSPQYVSDVLQGRREPGDSILAGLGLQKVVYYEVKE